MSRNLNDQMEDALTPSESKHGLLIGFRTDHLVALAQQVPYESSNLRVALNAEDIKRIFAQETIDYVVYGCEHDTEYRLHLLGQILMVSPQSEAHLLGQGSDPILFVSSLLRQLANQMRAKQENVP